MIIAKVLYVNNFKQYQELMPNFCIYLLQYYKINYNFICTKISLKIKIMK